MNDFVGYIDDEGNVFDGTFQYEGQVGPIGPQGIPGYTPQRGVDYWTESDQETIVTEATSLINGKIEEYNDNAAAKTEAFNDNASSKTTTFNSNFTTKMNKFNENSTEQKADFNANALEKTGDFNTNAGDKTDAFDSHVTSKTTDFDSHVDDEFNELTGSFYTKSQTYSKDEVDGLISSTYHYKGSVTDYSYLPSSGQQVGDVYNLENAGGGYNAGDNVAWTGTDWDKLAGTVDLSNYYTKGQVDNIANTKQNVIDSSHKLLSDNVDDTNQTNKFVTSAEKTTWNNKSDFSGSYNDLSNTPDLTQYEEKSNKTNELSGNSTQTQYPNAEIVYKWLDSITPSNEVSGETIHVEDSSNLPIKDFAMLGNATQADTPTPDTPQDIHVVTGDNVVKVYNNNIGDMTDLYNDMYAHNSQRVTQETIDNKNCIVFRVSDYTSGGGFKGLPNRYKANTRYQLDCDVRVYDTSQTSGNGIYVRIANANGTILKTTYASASGSTWQHLTLITDINTSASYITFGYEAQNRWCLANLSIQEYTGAEYEYIPSQSQSITLSLGNIELAKIGDYTDKLFKAIEGDSVYDSLDSTTKASLTSGAWYIQKATGNLLNYNADNYDIQSSYNLENYATFYAKFSNCLPNASQWSTVASMCTHLTQDSWFYMYNTTSTPDRSNKAFYSIKNASSNNIYFRLPKTIATTVEEFLTWANNQHFQLYYQLATPTYTQITDTTLISQLENVLKMHTNKNVTNGWIEPSGTNAQGGMVLVYRQDIQTLITNNTNAILSLGNNT